MSHRYAVEGKIDLEDVQDYATSERLSLAGLSDVTWMNQQLFNVLAQKTRGNSF